MSDESKFFNQKDLRDADERVRLLFRARDSLKSRGKCFCDDCVKELANIQEAYQQEYDLNEVSFLREVTPLERAGYNNLGEKMPEPEENADRPAVDWGRVHAVAIRDDDGRVRVYPPERAEIILTGGPDSTGGLTEDRPAVDWGRIAGFEVEGRLYAKGAVKVVLNDGPDSEAKIWAAETLENMRVYSERNSESVEEPAESNQLGERGEDLIVKLIRREILKYKADSNGYLFKRRDVN